MSKNTAVNLLYEALVVKRLKRTGWQILGENEETVGQHIFMTSVIAYLLAKKTGVQMETVLIMSVFHDFHESRTGDLDKIATLYLTRDTDRANRDIFSEVDESLVSRLYEYEEKKSKEAKVVYEANIIALLLELKVLVENGSIHASEWFEANKKRLRLPEAIVLADQIEKSDSQDWWKSIRDKVHGGFAK